MSSVRKASSMHAPGVVLRIQRGKRGDHLFLDIHHGGVRKREFLRLYLTGDEDADRTTLLKAEELRTARLQQLHARRHGASSIEYQWQLDFITYFETLSSSRGKNWGTTLSHLRRAFRQPQPFAHINESWIESFVTYLRRSGLHNNSVTVYVDTVRTALNIAVRERMIPTNPCDHIDTPHRKRTERTYLTFQELQLLLAATCGNAEVKRAFLFACFTGLRLSDIRALTWGNVRDDGLHITQKKTGDYNHIPLAEQAASLIGTRPNAQDPNSMTTPVFRLPKSDDLINRHLKKWAKRAGINKQVTSHVARHTFATMLVSSNANLYTIQHLLGHRDIRVTQIYARLLHHQKVDAIAGLPLLTTSHSADLTEVQLPLLPLSSA